MTERKPGGVSWESWIERQIQDAQRDGAFDELPGRGRPIDGLGVVHDELWWTKAKLHNEGVDYLPPTIAIRLERGKAVEAAMRAQSEGEARAIVEHVNARIRDVNRRGSPGPPSTTVVIDVESLLDRWRSLHPEPVAPLVPPPPAVTTHRRSWPRHRRNGERQRWRWLRRRLQHLRARMSERR